MIDLTPVENWIKDTGEVVEVQGLLSIKQALEQGISHQKAAFVYPLVDNPKKISSGNFIEYKKLERFAVAIAMRNGGRGSSNADFAQLHHAVVEAIIGKQLPGTEHSIEIGPGGLLPSKHKDCAFWQIEFTTTAYMGVNI